MDKNYSDPRIRIASLSGFRELLQELGFSAQPLLKQFGLNAKILDDPDGYISYVKFIELLGAAASLSGCAEFGLRLAQHQGSDILGVVGLLARQESTIGHAIESVVHHLHLHVEGPSLTLENNSGTACLRFDINIPGLKSRRQAVERLIGLALGMMRVLLGENWSPVAVYFAHGESGGQSALKRLLKAPVVFNWDYDGIMFPSETLELPIQHADSQLQRYLRRYINILESQYGEDIEAKTRQLISDSIGSRQCALPLVAQHLGMDSRTLQRRLREAGTCYKTLLEQVRVQLATRHLLDSRKPITEIAYLLGYSEVSAFSRSFKHWNAMSPKTWRKTEARRGEGDLLQRSKK